MSGLSWFVFTVRKGARHEDILAGMEKVQAKNESMIKALQPGKVVPYADGLGRVYRLKIPCLNRTRCQRHNCRKCHRTRQDLARTCCVSWRVRAVLVECGPGPGGSCLALGNLRVRAVLLHMIRASMCLQSVIEIYFAKYSAVLAGWLVGRQGRCCQCLASYSGFCWERVSGQVSVGLSCRTRRAVVLHGNMRQECPFRQGGAITSGLSWFFFAVCVGLTILHLCCRVSCSFLGAVLAVRAVPFGLLLGVMAGACVLVRGHAVARANHRVRIHGVRAVPAKDRAVLAHVQCRIRANPPSCKMSGLGPKVLS